MKHRTRTARCVTSALMLCLAAGLVCLPAVAQEKAGAEDDLAKTVHEVLKKMRVIAFDLPTDPEAGTGGRVVLVRLDRKDQMIVNQGKMFTPEVGIAFTVDKINKDGSAYVSGSGISMGRIKVATRKERETWSRKLREGGFAKPSPTASSP